MKRIIWLLSLTIIFMRGGSQVFATDWYMAGANPQRTDSIDNEIQGSLKVEWYRPIDPYILQNSQVIAANNTLFVSTSRGLYALNAADGAQKWVFPTELPLGNSPTYVNGVVYVGGLDKKLYAIDANSGSKLWSYDGAEAGYDTNPLVVNKVVYAGNRDGYMYAIGANDASNKGQLVWKFKTDGPINQSAAFANNRIYFASNDSYGYALDAASGNQIWKSFLPTQGGFRAFWPVIAGNSIIFQGVKGYRHAAEPFYTAEKHGLIDPETSAAVNGNYIFPAGDTANTLDLTPAANFFRTSPWRRTYYVLDIGTGVERKFDIDGDGQANEYAPLFQSGKTASGATHPPAVGPDGKLYASIRVTAGEYGRGGVSGWQIGSKYLSLPPYNTSNDEPLAYSLGGRVAYSNLCCDREIFSYLVDGSKTVWNWSGYNDFTLATLAPGYDTKYAYRDSGYGDWNKVYGGIDGVNSLIGVYGVHALQNAPIPYNGKVYMHRSNAIIAFSPTGGAKSLSLWGKQTVSPSAPGVNIDTLKQKLSTEIAKVIAAGHLRPGYGLEGTRARPASNGEYGDHLVDYFHDPADTFLALSLAYPHVSSTQQTQIKSYLDNEFAKYNPFYISNTGYATGEDRNVFTVAPEVASAMTKYGMSDSSFSGYNWSRPPQIFYALWKYALIASDPRAKAQELLSQNVQAGQKLGNPPDDATLAKFPFAHNQWIAGYRGYMELEVLAGNITDITKSSKYATYQSLLSKKASNFKRDGYWTTNNLEYIQGYAVARNFIGMTPELGDYIKSNSTLYNSVQSAFTYYEEAAPFWFVTNYQSSFKEDAQQHLYDYSGMFLAKAAIFKAPREELAKYLDVPAFSRGDMFYIQNLAYTIGAASSGTPATSPAASSIPVVPGDTDGDGHVTIVDYNNVITDFGSSSSRSDFNKSGTVDIVDYNTVVTNFGR